MNIIFVLCDTLRRDHLGCYGSKTVLTPTLDRLAEEAVVFDQFYSGSFPTLPCRAELFTGRFVWPYLDWGPLPASESTLAEILAEAGYTCALVMDNLHIGRPGYGYDRGFHTRIHVRGQWYDPWIRRTTKAEGRTTNEQAGRPAVGSGMHPKTGQPERLAQYLRNTSLRRSEADWFAPQVFTQAVRWLEENGRRAPFFLHVDCFDPHEPWDPPPHYVDLYDPGWDGLPIILPVMGRADRYTPEEIRHLRALYAGEVTMADAWFGRLLEALDQLGLRDETALFFMSDHGILLGERGRIGKMGGKKANLRGWPTGPELSHVPLLARVPGVAPGRCAALGHPGDLMPTALELAGVKPPERVRAQSLVPLLERRAERIREVAISSWSLRDWSRYRPSVLRTQEWALYTWRCDLEPELYHRPSDPNEQRNVFREHRGMARKLHGRYVRFLRENDAPHHNYWSRRFWAPWFHRPMDGEA
jgi:arylsulfatase A-like enzyme